MHEAESLGAEIADLNVNGQYAHSNPDWLQNDSPWKAGQILQLMTRNAVAARSVREIGCGAGEILASLQRQLPPDTCFKGFEPSPHAFQIAARKANPRLSFVNAIRPVDGEHFDLALLIDVIEHIDDYLGVLNSLRQTASRFIFYIPLDLSVLSVLREWPLAKRPQSVGDIHYFTKGTPSASLQDTGYCILDHFYTEIQRETEWNVRSFLMKRLPLRALSASGLTEVGVRIFGDHSLMVLAASQSE